MSVSFVFILILVLAVASAIVYFVWMQAKKSGKPPKKGSTRTPQAGKKRTPVAQHPPYRSTSIKPGKEACAAVTALAETRFLVEEGDIPPLPVEGCDSANCSCKYVKHVDRREYEDEDRRDIVGGSSSVGSVEKGDERRSGRERRRGSELEWRDS